MKERFALQNYLNALLIYYLSFQNPAAEEKISKAITNILKRVSNSCACACVCRQTRMAVVTNEIFP